MANKQFTKFFFCLSLLLLTFSIKYSEGAFLSYQAITDALSTPNEPNYPFYNNNLLHLIIGVNGGNIGSEASLAQFNSGGTIVKNISFPLPCLEEGCTIQGALFGLVNNSAYISLRRSEPHNAWACMIYQINLISFQLMNSSNALNASNTYYCAYSLPIWFPYNSTHSLISERWFEYETLTIFNEDFVPIYAYGLGGSSSALADKNLIFYQEMDGYSENFVTQNVETYKEEHLELSNGIMMVFLGDNSTNVAITTTDYDGYFNITLVDVASAYFKDRPSSNRFVEGEYQSGFFGDSSNNIFFINNDEGGDEKGISISQFKVDVSNNNHTVYDKITIVNYERENSFYSPYFSVLSWGLNEASQQFALVAFDIVTNSAALLLVDYDNSLSPYFN